MKCISLMQPFATLVVIGAKQYETRGWQTEYRGPLVIHAGRKFSEEARALCLQEPFRSALVRAGYRRSSDLPLGALLGRVTIDDCLPTATVLQQLQREAAELAFGDFRTARWAWKLSEPEVLKRPQTFAGRLGLFDVPWQTDLPFLAE